MSASHDSSQRVEPKTKGLNIRKIEFIEIYQPISGIEVQNQAQRCLSCGSPYCEWKCPLHNHIPNWLKLAAEGKILEAAELCHHTNSLPEVCGRVCPQEKLCEAVCVLNETFGSVTIGHLEREITDKAFELSWRPDISHVTATNKRVAIIGAGPAGLGCADVLARNGVQVTVFDRHPEIGGLLTFGIPAFKLEKTIMQHRRQIFEEMGIKFKLDCQIGHDIPFESLLNDFDAVFIATGTYQPIDGQLTNLKAIGVYNALPYLVANTRHLMHYPENTDFPYINVAHQRVVVLGGGDTAMDCVRTAIRQGAQHVSCLYRRKKTDMPAAKREVLHAEEEGVDFYFNLQPVSIKVNKNHHVVGVNTTNTQYSVNEKNTVELPADIIIIAFGFESDPMPWLPSCEIQRDPQGRIKAQRHSEFPYQTSHHKVFAGGDVVHGSDLVVTAIADGRGAAEGILLYLGI